MAASGEQTRDAMAAVVTTDSSRTPRHRQLHRVHKYGNASRRDSEVIYRGRTSGATGLPCSRLRMRSYCTGSFFADFDAADGRHQVRRRNDNLNLLQQRQ
jgi:hypothetical protein